MKGHETSDIKNMSFNAFLFSNIRSFLLVSCTKLIALANEIITELLYLVSRHLWHYVFRVEDTNQDGLFRLHAVQTVFDLPASEDAVVARQENVASSGQGDTIFLKVLERVEVLGQNLQLRR